MTHRLRRLSIAIGLTTAFVACMPGVVAPAFAADAPPPSAEASQSAAPATTPTGGGGPLQLKIYCQDLAHGTCSLDDIVRTGAAFANLLTELSAAFFFATFVYGGARYLLSFGSEKGVTAGKKAITGGAIGMAIVLGAWTIVNYIANSLTGKS